MFSRDRIYTVHDKPEMAEPSERTVLVREGFAVWAFFFGAMWLLVNRLWIPFFAYIAIAGLLVGIGQRIGISDASITVLQLGLQYLLAHSAYDLQRWVLARRGYRMRGVIVANSELMAEQRAFQHLQTAA